MNKPKKLGRYMLRYLPMYVLSLGCLLLATVLEAVSPQITQRIIDKGIVVEGLTLDERVAIILPMLLLVLGIGIVRAAAGYIKEFTADTIGVKIGRDMRRDLFEHITGLSMSYFHKTNTGELMARTKDDIDKVWFVLGFGGVLTLECIIHTVLSLICMFRYSPLLTFVPIIFMALVAVIALRMEKKLDSAYGEVSEANAELTTVAQENLSGVRTVKAFSREGFEIDKFKAKNNKYYDTSMELARVYRKYYPYINVVGKVLVVLVTALGSVLVIAQKGYIDLGVFKNIAGTMTAGKLVAFVEYATGIIWPMECLGWLANELASALASQKKLKKIFSETSEISDPEDPVKPESITGNLAFNNVSFKPDGKTVIENVSFDLPLGRTLGIMGMTGSGKSSVINLAERFYDVTEGSVTLDGIDIRNLELNTLRSTMSVVMQDVFLFSDSIAENIKLGSNGALTQEEMEEAAKDAGASEFIDKLTERYDTIIGERGVGLSGGQKQRISIARALAKKPKILILDDATSALDMETEYEIQRSLDALRGCSKIIVAHRVSAVKDCDEIIVLDEGRIIERGTHSQLMANRGQYFATYVAQYNTEEDLVERSDA